jgi:hypothetical protein
MDMSIMPIELKVYFHIAVICSVLFLLKIAGIFIGTDQIGTQHDGTFADFDFESDGMDSAEAFSVFTIQSAIAFGMIFGWSTLAARTEYGFDTIPAIAIGSALGVGAAFMSAYLMKLTTKLNTPVSRQYKVEVGTKAKTYLKVPANGQGFGIIQVTHKETTYEVRVKNNQATDIPSHSFVKVVAIEPEVVVELDSEQK